MNCKPERNRTRGKGELVAALATGHQLSCCVVGQLHAKTLLVLDIARRSHILIISEIRQKSKPK